MDSDSETGRFGRAGQADTDKRRTGWTPEVCIPLSVASLMPVRKLRAKVVGNNFLLTTSAHTTTTGGQAPGGAR
jgi:hypothetical protein